MQGKVCASNRWKETEINCSQNDPNQAPAKIRVKLTLVTEIILVWKSQEQKPKKSLGETVKKEVWPSHLKCNNKNLKKKLAQSYQKQIVCTYGVPMV